MLWGGNVDKISYKKVVLIAGFESLRSYMLKFLLPVMITSFLAYFILMFMFPEVSTLVRTLMLGAGILLSVFYPYIAMQKIKKNINENLHLFITYAATISTLGIQRDVLFEKLGQKEFFGEISKISARIHYFAKKWTLGFSAACHNISKYIPSKILSDFIDRFGVMMSFGEDLSVYLLEEQDAVMEGYALEYKKSLENIKLIQEIFVSISITIAFLMAVALLFPLISGISIESVMQFALIFIIIINISFVVIVISFIPQDKLIQMETKEKSKEAKRTRKYLMILGPVSVLLLLTLLILNKLPFLFSIFLGSLPMIYVGIISMQEEKAVDKKEKMFPEFIRSMGAALAIKKGELTASIDSLRIHNFGVLNKAIESMYRRVKVRVSKMKIWFYFAVDSGSKLIYNFIHIFSESTHLGGDPVKISEIVSKNFSKVLSLRKQKLQIVSSFRGAMFGVLFGITLTSFVASQTSQLLANLFLTPMEGEDATATELMKSSIGNIIPEALSTDIDTVNLYIGIMILVYSITCSVMVKIVDGGRLTAAFIDFSIMIFIGAVASWLIPMAFGKLNLIQAVKPA